MTDFDSLEQQYGLPKGLLAAVQQQESGGDPNAVSPAGALGAFQFMPATAKQYGIDPLDPAQAAHGAARYLGDLSKKYGGNIHKALAAYNWGPGNVDKHGTDNLPDETKNYVSKITANLPTTGSATRTIDATLGSTANADMMPEDDYEVVDNTQPAQEGGAHDDYEVVDQPQKQGLLQSVLGMAKYADPSLYGADLLQHPEKIQTALQGPTFGFGDEIQAGLATPLIAAGKAIGRATGQTTDNPSMSQIYDFALHQARDPVKQFEASNPGEATALQLGASLPVGGLKVGGSVLQAVRNLRGAAGEAAGSAEAADAVGNAVKQLVTGVAKGAANGSAAGAAYGFGSGEGGALDRLERAYSGAGYGSLVGGAGGAIPGLVSVAGKTAVKAAQLPATISNKLATITDENGVISMDKARQLASAKYQQASSSGAILNPSFSNKFVDQAESVLPQTTAGKTVAGEDAAAGLVDRLQGLRNKPLSLQEAQEVDEHLSDLIDSNTNMGKLNKTGYKIQKIQNNLRAGIEDAGDADIASGDPSGFQALKDARAMWSSSYKLGDIQRILDRASMSEQPATTIKSGFRTLLNNPNKLRGYTPDEIQMMRKATQTGIGTGLVKLMGSRLIPIIELSHGGLTGGAVTYGVGTVARAAAERMQSAPARQLQGQLSDRILSMSKR